MIIAPNKVYHLIRQIIIMIGISYLNPFCCNVILYCYRRDIVERFIMQGIVEIVRSRLFVHNIEL